MLAAESDSDEAELDPYEDGDSDEEYEPAQEDVDSDAEIADQEIHTELNSESESDDNGSDRDEPIAMSDQTFFHSKDGTKWCKTNNTFVRQGAQNIIRESLFMGPNPNTKNLSPLDTFFCIISSPIRDQIIRFSNKKAEQFYKKWNTDNPFKTPAKWTSITDDELKAFFGILLVMGSQKSSQQKASELWKQNSFPLNRATMSLKRFQQILRFIRFDNHATRAIRQSEDKAAPIRDIFQMINSNLRNHFRPYETITVDEQLFGYRGRTKFTQYIPSKPAKYGMKIWWACDATTFYPLNGQIYTGKEGNTRDVNQGERVVKDLVAPYKNSGRNVTMDNFFTSLPLLQELITWKMTIVGTLKKNKRYIPEEFKASKRREVLSSEFGFGQNATICSYVPAKGKSVVLLSSMHRDSAVSNIKKKPEMILFYNKTKGGVDTMDKMVSQYSTKRSTTRWPLAMFFNLLDVSALAAYIIYFTNNPHGEVKKSRRREFIQTLGENLCIPQIKIRAQNPLVVNKFPIRTAIECILGMFITDILLDKYLSAFTISGESISVSNNDDEEFVADDIPQRDSSGRIKQKGGCYMCYRDDKRKRATRQACVKCKKPICAVHSFTQTKCEDCHIGPSTSSHNLRT